MCSESFSCREPLAESLAIPVSVKGAVGAAGTAGLLVWFLLFAWFGLSGCGDREAHSATDLDEPIELTELTELRDQYLEHYFATFPSRATAAGRHDLDGRLEDLSPEVISRWVEINRETGLAVERLLQQGSMSDDDRLDGQLLLAETEQQLFDFETVSKPTVNPMFWSGILGNATVFLVARDDLPSAERLASAAERAAQIPRLAARASTALSQADPAEVSAELCAMAERQLRASARFYDEGLPKAAQPGDLRDELERAGDLAAAAMLELAEEVAELGTRATGSPRLADLYAERFRIVTRSDQEPAQVLRGARQALDEKLAEAATFGRSIYSQFVEGEPPEEDRELLRRLFARVAEDHAASVEEFVADYKSLLAEAEAFVRSRDIVTLPDPLTVFTDRSPDYFVGQSVGGVYAAGPYDPEADTLFYLPTPSPEATPEQREAFFRDFNHHFNVMITGHEMMPGHYLQLKHAARHPRKMRSLFSNGVYVEGWGTFCERLMLDQGWGTPLARVAHLKKQIENIARTIVDIEVHTHGMSRDEVLRFVQEDALQDRQFASNMWSRAITSTPQLTSYWLGYEQIMSLYLDVKEERGDDFVLRDFMDGMMALGPVSVAEYRASLLAD